MSHYGMDQYNNIKIRPISSDDRYIYIERKGKNIIRSSEDVKTDSCSNLTIAEVSHSSEFTNDQKDAESEPNTFDGRLDSVRSGESLIKCYRFESECNKDTDKIIAFWKAIDEHKEIQPVRSTIRASCEPVKISSESESTNSERSEQYAWYDAFMAMKKQKMDQVARAANGRQCHFCDLTQTCASKSKRNQTEELDAKDVMQLNDWKPQIPKEPKGESTEVLHKLQLDTDELWDSGSLSWGTSIGEEQIEENAEEESQVVIVEDSPLDSTFQSSLDDEYLPPDAYPIERCPICSYEHCVCRERLDEQAKEFMEELQSRMASLYQSELAEDIPNDTEKSAAICCEFCDDPHICSLMSKDLAGDTKLPAVNEDDCLKIIFKLNSPVQSISDVIPVGTDKETKDNSGQKVKKVTYVKAEDSNLFDQAESTIITPKASRTVSIAGVERYEESDDSLIVYVEPLSWYAPRPTK